MTRNKRSSEEWFSLIQECRTAGLAVRDFCGLKGVHPSNFYYWAKRLQTTEESGFVPVTISKPTAKPFSHQILEIVYPNGVSLRLGSEIDIRMLAQLIRL
jgi:hypothetical protein